MRKIEVEFEELPDVFTYRMLSDGTRVGYTTKSAAGAIPNGTTIIKQNAEAGDTNPNGTLGIIIGSCDSPPNEAINKKNGFIVKFLYFVDWNNSGIPVGTIDHKIKIKP